MKKLFLALLSILIMGTFAPAFPSPQSLSELTPASTIGENDLFLISHLNGGVWTSESLSFATLLANLSLITLSNNTTGNAATATQLAATPSTCSAGYAALGVDAYGNAQGCWQPSVLTVSGTPTQYQWPYWISASVLGAKAMAANSAVGTDSNGAPAIITGMGFKDSGPALMNYSDNTKLGQFDLSLLTTGTTRIMHWRDKNFTPAALEGDTFTGEIGVPSVKYNVLSSAPSPCSSQEWMQTDGKYYCTPGGTVIGPIGSTSYCTATIPTFTAVTGAATSTLETSNTVTIALSGCVTSTISISGNSGQYSINGGAYTASAGSISNGNTVTVQQTSSTNTGTQTISTISIAGSTQPYSVTTGGATIPAFTAVTGEALSQTAVTSNTVTTAGGYSGQTVTVSGNTGCEYKQNGGSFTAASGTSSSGDTFQLEVNSSASNYTLTSCQLSIGTTSKTFNVTTIPAAPTGLTPTPGNGQVSIAFTGSTGEATANGYYGTSSNPFSTGTKVTGVANPWVPSGLNNGTLNYFTVTAVDTYGNESAAATQTSSTPYTITISTINAQTGIALSTTGVTSNTVTTSGGYTGQTVSVSGDTGCQYSKNFGAYTASSGTSASGDTFTLEVNASASNYTSTACTLTVGTATRTFTITTI